MSRIAIGIGLLLIALGLIAYFILSDAANRSITALIPAFFGLPIMVLGFVALHGGKARKHAMHGAVALAGIGLVGALMRPGLALVRGNAVDFSSTAFIVQLIMAVLCLVFIILSVRAFVLVRRAGSTR